MKKKLNYWRQIQRFSIRKLSIGVVSATIGMTTLGLATTTHVAADEVRSEFSSEKVQITYKYINYEDLTQDERESLVLTDKDLTEEIAEKDATYILVYRKEGNSGILPATGDLSAPLLSVLGSLGVVSAWIALKKDKKKTALSVIILTASGITLSATDTQALENSFRQFLTETHLVSIGSHLPQPEQIINNHAFRYYIKEDESQITTNLNTQKTDSTATPASTKTETIREWTEENYPTTTEPETSEEWSEDNFPTTAEPETSEVWSEDNFPTTAEPETSEVWSEENFPTTAEPETSEEWTEENFPTTTEPETSEEWSEENFPTPTEPEISEEWSEENFPTPAEPEISEVWTEENYPTPAEPETNEEWAEENYPTPAEPETSEEWSEDNFPTPTEPETSEEWTEENYPTPAEPETNEEWTEENYPTTTEPETNEEWSEENYPTTQADNNSPQAIRQTVRLNTTPDATNSILSTSVSNVKTITWKEGETPATTALGLAYGTAVVTYEDDSTDEVAVSVEVIKQEEKPVLTITDLETNEDKRTATVTYDLSDPDKTYVSATAKVYKKDANNQEELVTTILLPSPLTLVEIAELDYYTPYVLKTELTYTVNGKTTTETLTDERPFELEYKRVEFKHVSGAELYEKQTDGSYKRLYTLDSLPTDYSSYFVKVTSDQQKDIYLAVSNVQTDTVDGRAGFTVTTTSPQLIQYDETTEENDQLYSFFIRQTQTSSNGKYRTFSDLITAMRADLTGTFEIDEDLRVDDFPLENGATTYISGNFSGTLLGNNYAISGLKAPLFNQLTGNFQIKDLDIKDASISNSSNEWGILARKAYGVANSSLISNVAVKGNLTIDRDGGGLVFYASNTKFDQVSYEGKLTTSNNWNWNRTGGIVGILEGTSSLTNANVSIDGSFIGSANGAGTSKIGGVVGHADGNITIKNIHATGYMTRTNNSSYTGGIIGQAGSNVRISNVVSQVAVTGGNPIIGDTSVNAAVIDKASVSLVDASDTFATTKTATEADQQVTAMNLTATIDNSPNSNYARYDVDYSTVINYTADNLLKYKNIEKLLPFYNKETIVKYGNLLTDGKLATNAVISVTPLIDNVAVADYSNQKQAINRLLVYYSDNTKEYLNVTFKEDFKDTGIAEYTIANTKLIYTPEQFLTNYASISDGLVNEVSGVDYYGAEMKALFGLTDSNVKDTMDKLYLKEAFNTVKENLATILNATVATANAYASSTGDSANLISTNKAALLLGLSYMQRWYNIDFDTTNIRDIATYYQNFFGKPVDTLEFLIGLGKSYSSLKPANNLNTFTYTLGVNSDHRDLVSYLDTNRELFTTWDANTWFRNTTDALLVERQSNEVPDRPYTVYDKITSLSGEKNGLLPLLTAREGVIVISNMSGLTYSMYDRYIDPALKSDATAYAAKVEALKAMANQAGDWQRDHFDAWYRILPEASRKKLSTTNVTTWDGYMVNSKWLPLFGDSANNAILDFFGPIERGRSANNGSGAYNDGTASYFVWNRALDEYGSSVWSHETVHNFDGGIYLLNNGRRTGMHAEAFPTGLLQMPANGASSGYFVLNMMYDFTAQKDSETRYQNLSPERFSDANELQEYVHGMMDVLYTLDYAEARSVLAQSEVIHKRWYKKLSNNIVTTKKTKTDTTNSTDYYAENVISDFTEEDWAAMDLKTVDDLIDNNVVVSRGHSNTTYGHGGYYWMDMFDTIYSMLPMETGAPSTFMFSRFAYDLLADKGYEDGFVPYTSNKYAAEALAAGEKVYSDWSRREVGLVTDKRVLTNIYGDKYSTWQDFKKAMFKERIDKLDTLKSVTFNYDGRSVTINSYNDLELLMAQAVYKDIANNTISDASKSAVKQLKQRIYNAYLRSTDDFKQSIFGE